MMTMVLAVAAGVCFGLGIWPAGLFLAAATIIVFQMGAER